MLKPLFFISSSLSTSPQDFFGLPRFIFSGTLLIKFAHPFFQGVQVISVWFLPNDSLYPPLMFYLSASHSEFYHEASFHTSFWLFTFLLPAFVWCQPSSSPNIQIHRFAQFLITFLTQDLYNDITLPHSILRYLTKFSPANTARILTFLIWLIFWVLI